jgi:hypothetical protein
MNNENHKSRFTPLTYILIAIILSSCASDYATSTRVFPTYTYIIPTTTIVPTKTPLPQVPVGIIQVRSLNVRSGDGLTYGVIGSLKRGDEVYILANFVNPELQRWYLVLLPDNSFGFVFGEPGYVTEKMVSVDYSTYSMLVNATQRAQRIYATPGQLTYAITPTKVSLKTIPTIAIIPISSIACDEANLYIGENKTVCGLVVESKYASSSNGQPTFLTLCEKYPDPNRFSVVIWGRNRGNFPANPEQYYYGEIICVSGLIEEYNGIPEIEVSSPLRIEIR